MKAGVVLVVETTRTHRVEPLSPKHGGRVFAAEVAKAKRATRGGTMMEGWTLVVREGARDVVRVEVESGSVALVTVTTRRRTAVPADVLLVAMRVGNMPTFGGGRSW